jgi:hypothetical protein
MEVFFDTGQHLGNSDSGMDGIGVRHFWLFWLF